MTIPQFENSGRDLFQIKPKTGSPAHFLLISIGSVTYKHRYRCFLTCAGLTDDHQQVDGGPLRVWTAAVSTHFIPGIRPQALRHLTVGQGTADYLIQVKQPGF